jgi:acyl carrier protein
MTSKKLVRGVLWALWCEALGRPVPDRIVDRENFLDSGGDSVMAMMLHAAIEERLAQRIELADVLDVLAGADFDALAELVGGTTRGDGHNP